MGLLTTAQVARKMGITRQAVGRLASRRGIEPLRAGRNMLFTEQQAAKLGKRLRRKP